MTTRHVEPCYTFHKVPNNAKGRAFVAALHRYKNVAEVGRIRLRGTGLRPGAERNTPWGDLPIAQARTLRVYLDEPHARRRLAHARLSQCQDALVAARDARDKLSLELDRAVVAAREANKLTQLARDDAAAAWRMTEELAAQKEALARGMRHHQSELNRVPRWILACVALVYRIMHTARSRRGAFGQTASVPTAAAIPAIVRRQIPGHHL